MTRTNHRGTKAGHGTAATMLLLALSGTCCALASGCGSSRPTQTSAILYARRDEHSAKYLADTRDLTTSILVRNRAQLDDYKAGRRPDQPIIDYLILTGGGDYGAFGAGFL